MKILKTFVPELNKSAGGKNAKNSVEILKTQVGLIDKAKNIYQINRMDMLIFEIIDHLDSMIDAMFTSFVSIQHSKMPFDFIGN